ncbi:hypothetical protein BRC63_09905 [Halobacteriales archaeon QH_10_70_21]|jgi:hypothetical protein|nr:MAG: hypothetical protein BRC63_09905 [Halobacteriales archaeon QH_10_70_21]
MWACAIDDCAYSAEAVEDLLVHQARSHERHECAVCHAIVPDGYFAIRHAFDEHSRDDYMRHYDADADDVRTREAALDAVEEAADVEAVAGRLDDVDAPGE